LFCIATQQYFAGAKTQAGKAGLGIEMSAHRRRDAQSGPTVQIGTDAESDGCAGSPSLFNRLAQRGIQLKLRGVSFWWLRLSKSQNHKLGLERHILGQPAYLVDTFS
jgi:hypothetical protein